MRVQDMSKKKDERVEVLGNGPIPDIKLGPAGVIGDTPGAEKFEEGAIQREHIDVVSVAPIIGDATAKHPERDLPAGRSIRTFRVVNPGGKHVNDVTGGGRVFLHEGKEITNQHYDLRRLQQQGLRIKEIEDGDEPVEDIIDV
jgi:hypothetical protein